MFLLLSIHFLLSSTFSYFIVPAYLVSFISLPLIPILLHTFDLFAVWWYALHFSSFCFSMSLLFVVYNVAQPPLQPGEQRRKHDSRPLSSYFIPVTLKRGHGWLKRLHFYRHLELVERFVLLNSLRQPCQYCEGVESHLWCLFWEAPVAAGVLERSEWIQKAL